MKLIYLTLILLLGSSIASFLTLVAYRLPKGESIVSPGSKCEGCNVQIDPFAKIPILGYLLALGKCSNCHFKIQIIYPLSELYLGLLFIKFSNCHSFLLLFDIVMLFFLSTTDYFYGYIFPYLLIPNTMLHFILGSFNWQLAIATFLIFAVLALNNALGLGDAEVLSFLALSINIENFLLVIVLSCAFALINCLIFRKNKIRFVPMIFLSYTFILLF